MASCDRSGGSARVVAILLLLGPLVSLFKSLVMAPLLAVVALSLLVGRDCGLGWRAARTAFDTYRTVLIPIFVLLAWALTASLWSFDPAFSLKSVLMLLGTVVGGLVMVRGLQSFTPDQWRWPILGLAGGLGLACLVIATIGVVERAGWLDVGMLLYRMDADTTVIALLLWPTLAWLDRFGHRGRALLLLALAVPAIALSHDLAAKVALLAAGLAWLAGRRRWHPTVLAVGAGVVAAALLSPLAAGQLPPPSATADWTWLPASAHHRMTIWSFTAGKIADRPLLGWGFDSARAIPGGKTIIAVVRLKGCARSLPPVAVPGRDEPVAADCVLWEESMPLHPHNAWLQIWLELGGIGAAVTAWLVGSLAVHLGRQTAGPSDRAAAIATFVAALIVCSVSYGIWQSWWQSTLWIAVAMTTPLLRPGAVLPANDDRRGNPG